MKSIEKITGIYVFGKRIFQKDINNIIELNDIMEISNKYITCLKSTKNYVSIGVGYKTNTNEIGAIDLINNTNGPISISKDISIILNEYDDKCIKCIKETQILIADILEKLTKL